MRILCTNDDGIHAPGLKVIEEIALDYFGQRVQNLQHPLLERLAVVKRFQVRCENGHHGSTS